MSFCIVQQKSTESTAKDVHLPSLFSPARIALAALAVLALSTPRAQPGFQMARAFDAGAAPVFVAAGDFNGDGLMDLAVANYDASGTDDSGKDLTLSIL